MSKITLITGGTRSGKSSFGEKLYNEYDNVAYIATMKILDEEMTERVKLHKLSRNSKWRTIEAYKNLNNEISKIEEKYIILECIGTMITNIIFDTCSDIDKASKENIELIEKIILDEIRGLIQAIRLGDKEIIIVTNEVGFTLVSEYKLGRVFTDILGRVNQRIANDADEVYLVACGLPMRLK